MEHIPQLQTKHLPILLHFKIILRCNFKDKFTHYKDMRSASDQPGRLYVTAKTHKFNSLNKITVENLKFLPIISQKWVHTRTMQRRL